MVLFVEWTPAVTVTKQTNRERKCVREKEREREERERERERETRR